MTIAGCGTSQASRNTLDIGPSSCTRPIRSRSVKPSADEETTLLSRRPSAHSSVHRKSTAPRIRPPLGRFVRLYRPQNAPAFKQSRAQGAILFGLVPRYRPVLGLKIDNQCLPAFTLDVTDDPKHRGSYLPAICPKWRNRAEPLFEQVLDRRIISAMLERSEPSGSDLCHLPCPHCLRVSSRRQHAAPFRSQLSGVTGRQDLNGPQPISRARPCRV